MVCLSSFDLCECARAFENLSSTNRVHRSDCQKRRPNANSCTVWAEESRSLSLLCCCRDRRLCCQTLPVLTIPQASAFLASFSIQTDTLGSCRSGVRCYLTENAIDKYLDADSRTWFVDEAFLGGVDHDLQSLIDCTKEGDTILFNVSCVIESRSRVTIPWKLTLSAHVEAPIRDGETVPRSETKTRFTCPQFLSRDGFDPRGVFFVQ